MNGSAPPGMHPAGISVATPPPGDARPWPRWLFPAALLCCAWAIHGHSLTLGFWFDDHTHLELCRQNGFTHLEAGNQFDWNGHIAHAWWAQETTGWAYFRPLAVLLRGTLLTLFGLDPLPFHVVHLTLYSMSVPLFFMVLRRCGWGPGWSALAVLLFMVHPANYLTTPWIANDGPVLVGLFLSLGLLLMHASAQRGHGDTLPLTGVFLCYALAMLSRENGIMVGPLLVLFDFALAWRTPQTSWLRRSGIYAALALTGVLYLVLRTWCMGGLPSPRSPYFHWPSEPGFASWLPHKVLNELVCLPLGLPFVPILEVPWWQARPIATGGAVLLVLGLAAVFLYPLRRAPALWAVLGGIGLAQAPSQLVFSVSYNYYLASAGWATLFVLWARRFWPSRPGTVATVAALLASWYTISLTASALTLHSAMIAERRVQAEVLASGLETAPPGTRLFFINLPFFAAEVAPALRNSLDRRDLEVYPLTFAPESYCPSSGVVVAQEDERTLIVHAGENAFFGGDFGDQVQMGWYGARRASLRPGPVAIHPAAGPMPFRVEVLDVDDSGARSLRFVFDHPLNDPAYRFYASSGTALAEPLHFEPGARRRWAHEVPPDSASTLPGDLKLMRRTERGVHNFFAVLGKLP